MNKEITELLHMGATSRRQLVKATAIAGGLVAAGGLTHAAVAGTSLAQAAADTGGDLGILNYALTLEHLEDALYRSLIASGLLYGKVLKNAQIFGDHEHQHVVALTATIQKLGGTPVMAKAKYNFPKVVLYDQIIALLVKVEDLGASAYLGAAPLIKNNDVLTAAVEIHTVEAEHATAWRYLTNLSPVPFAFAQPSTMQQVVTAVTPFLS